MAGYLSMFRGKCPILFLNISFLFLIYLTTHLIFSSNSSDFLKRSNSNTIANYYQTLDRTDTDTGCKGLHRYQDNQSKCSYVKSHKDCTQQSGLGFISYLKLFYCTLTTLSPLLGYTSLVLWLLLLFYLLGDTAANYFCSSLGGLSRVLNLSPNIAGVTLLSLGNGAPDLFASIASFMTSSNNQVGLSSILGGSFFVSSIVVGIISISSCPNPSRGVSIDKVSFIRDVLFLIFSLLCLLLVIVFGKINLWGAISFLSLYFLYVFLVMLTSRLCGKDRGMLLPLVSNKSFPADDQHEPKAKTSELGAPLLGFKVDDLHSGRAKGRKWCLFLGKFFCNVLELPLYLPRRLTIPVVSEERWSKTCAIISVILSPVLLAVIWSLSHTYKGPSLMVCVIGGIIVGIILGAFAFFNTERSGPPKKCLFPWLAGGFLMSITWTYILAKELVSLLVSIGLVLGISPSILGLTVLAWGNSLGDLVSNVSMARNGWPDGLQVAISGCYAGPIFNTLVGLGFSLAFSSWTLYPSYYLIPRDTSVYETVGFLMGGLLWALVMLPKNSMRPSRFLGSGLLAIYLCFLVIKMARTLGQLQLT